MSFTTASLELKNSVNFSSRRILALFDSSVIGGNPKGVSGVLRGLWMTSRKSSDSHPSLCPTVTRIAPATRSTSYICLLWRFTQLDVTKLTFFFVTLVSSLAIFWISSAIEAKMLSRRFWSLTSARPGKR